MKHFVDIDRLRSMETNGLGFMPSDRIVIQTKIDGANASVTFEDGEVKCFSRKTELSPNNTLRGFWNYVQELDSQMFTLNPNYIFFGEWLIKHTLEYDKEKYNQWYVYDIYDKEANRYLPQNIVKSWCDFWGMNYVEVLYDGEFKSWDHVREFLHASKAYGKNQEGIVCKNQSKLSDDEVSNGRHPSYIKIVNAEFCEVKGTKQPKVIDPNVLAERNAAMELMSTIVTEARVRKEINKMMDEEIIPTELQSKDMGIIARFLPKRIIDDCVKEEKETFLKAGKDAGKIGANLTMNLARKIVLGA